MREISIVYCYEYEYEYMLQTAAENREHYTGAAGVLDTCVCCAISCFSYYT